MKQKTLKKAVEIKGVGLFSGEPVTVRVLPAPANAGWSFVRTDLPNSPTIPVSPSNAVNKPRRTSLSFNDVDVDTVEHILGSLSGLEINNAVIEISALEMPCMDGGSQSFVQALLAAGFEDQLEESVPFVVKEPITISNGDRNLIAMPPKDDDDLTISFTITGDRFAPQHLSYKYAPESFSKDIAPARTYATEEEVAMVISKGMGKGGTYENTLVIGKSGVIENQLRFPDEYVRHKILDVIGDLALLNFPVRANIVAVRTGHDENHKLARKIMEQKLSEKKPSKQNSVLDVRELLKILPHRYPFLLIDKVIEMDSYNKAVGIKNVTFNEPFFQGHFPGQPIMPGVLQIEAMAQLAGALLMRQADKARKIAVLMGLDEVKIRRAVVPGDQLRIEVQALKIKSRTGTVYTKATVDGELASEAYMKFMILDAEE